MAEGSYHFKEHPVSYVVLARRYRPQTLAEVIGQDHISRTINNAIAEKRLAHAYLFSGPRGCGKTTTARILAKALNCTSPKGQDPCGVCPNCVEIADSRSMDVLELDGASNRGIEEIRALRDNVKFAPASSQYKIYIIDEAHQITHDAFNALLKTLEEPPEHVLFILATTEPHKIPVTILSRCQRYRFRLLTTREIMSALEAIVEKEKVIVETAALKLVTSASGGSMRDALSLLDQAISMGTDKVAARDIENLLGLLPRRIIDDITVALSREDLASLLAIVKDMSQQGYNLIQLARDIREHLRRLLLFIVNPDLLDDMIDEEKAMLERHKPLLTPAWLMRAGHVLSRAIDEMRWSDQPRLALELNLLKLSQKYVNADDLVARLEALETNMPLPAAMMDTTPVASSGAPAPVMPEQPVPARPAEARPGGVHALWQETLAELQRVRPMAAGYINDTRIAEAGETTITVAVTSKFQEEGVVRNKDIIESILAKISGTSYGLRTIVAAAPAGMPAPAAAPAPRRKQAAPEETPPPAAEGNTPEPEAPAGELPPEVQKVMNAFSGRMTKKK